MFTNFLRRLTRRSYPLFRAGRPRSSYFHPNAESLEHRQVLSTATVAVEAAPKLINEDPLFGNHIADLMVTNVGAPGHSVTVFYKITGVESTANVGADLSNARASSSVHFNPGETVKHITFAGRVDTVDEDYEHFNIELTRVVVSGRGEGMFGNRFGTVTVQDNDDPPHVAVNGTAQFSETKSTRGYEFKLESRSEKTVTVNYAVTTQSPTLAYGTDLTVPGGQTGTLTFKPGELRKTVQVQVFEDQIVEPDEVFRVAATGGQNVNVNPLVFRTQLDVTIADDDKAVVSLRSNLAGNPQQEHTLEGNVGDTIVRLQIILGSDIEKNIDVWFATADGTATTADADYRTYNGGARFFEGAKSGTAGVVSFNVIGDVKKEAHERFYVKLLNNKAYRMVGSRVTVNIADDD